LTPRKPELSFFHIPLGRMCGSRKYPYPHHRGSLEIPRGRGGGLQRSKLLKEFPKGWGVQTKKTLYGGSMDIFWNNTI